MKWFGLRVPAGLETDSPPHAPFLATNRLQRNSSCSDVLLGAGSIRAFSRWEGDAAGTTSEGKAAARRHQEWTGQVGQQCVPLLLTLVFVSPCARLVQLPNTAKKPCPTEADGSLLD